MILLTFGCSSLGSLTSSLISLTDTTTRGVVTNGREREMVNCMSDVKLDVVRFPLSQVRTAHPVGHLASAMPMSPSRRPLRISYILIVVIVEHTYLCHPQRAL